jgi:hypothetical protein
MTSWSTSKWWRMIAYAVATYVIILNAKGISAELLGVYMAIVSGSEIAKAWIASKAGFQYERRASDKTITTTTTNTQTTP